MAVQDIGLLLLRLGIGVIFLVHGLPKIRKPKNMAKGMGWKPVVVVLLGLIEVLSAIAVIVGLYAEVAALLLALVMVGALIHKILIWKVSFIAMDKTGWELDLMLLLTALCIALVGPGLVAIETLL